MPRLIITQVAAKGIERCFKFLAQQDPAAVLAATEAVDADLMHLTRDPLLGRPYDEESELRELVIPFGKTGYLALYLYDEAADEVLVLNFRHQLEKNY